MWWMKSALREQLNQIEYTVDAESWRPSNGYPAQSAVVRVSDFDPTEEGDDLRGLLEGTCTIRSAKGRRALFLDLVLEVPWRGWIDAGTERERSLGGKTRLWNITHFNELNEWQHLNNRNTHETGPATDAIAERLAPAIAANAKLAVQEVLGALMFNRIVRARRARAPSRARTRHSTVARAHDRAPGDECAGPGGLLAAAQAQAVEPCLGQGHGRLLKVGRSRRRRRRRTHRGGRMRTCVVAAQRRAECA
jgi:hypothetical protein